MTSFFLGKRTSGLLQLDARENRQESWAGLTMGPTLRQPCQGKPERGMRKKHGHRESIRKLQAKAAHAQRRHNGTDHEPDADRNSVENADPAPSSSE
jgi:hypothetical protein